MSGGVIQKGREGICYAESESAEEPFVACYHLQSMPVRQLRVCVRGVILLVVLTSTFSGCTSFPDRGDSQQLFGSRLAFDPPTYRYNSAHNWQGDGYTLTVFEAPPELVALFRNPSNDLLSLRPWVTQIAPGRGRVSWQRSPIEDAYYGILDFALEERGGGRDLEQQFEALRNALSGTSSYYAFSYRDTFIKPGEITPENLRFVVVDLTVSRVYFITNNT